jgi:hypothetical protein
MNKERKKEKKKKEKRKKEKKKREKIDLHKHTSPLYSAIIRRIPSRGASV